MDMMCSFRGRTSGPSDGACRPKEVQPTGLARLRDVVYVGDAAGGGRIRLYGRDGAERGVLAPLGCRPDQLCVSPDGKWLYATCLQKGVFRMSLPEGRPELFVNEPRAGMRIGGA